MNYKLISRADAIKQGLSQYFTGKLCKQGHNAPRKVSGACLECHRLAQKLRYDSDLERGRDIGNRNMKKQREKPDHKRKQKDYLLKRNFHISHDEYDAMLLEQNNSCKICKSVCQSGRSLAVDHDHTTGQVRGLLCMNCNQGLGKFQDNIQLILAAAEYLK